MHSTTQSRTLPKWVARKGSSTVTVRAADFEGARTRAAQIGMRCPDSIMLATDHSANSRAAIKAYKAFYG